ncbi:cupin domain-containing protein [Pontibacter qinzhouensis]|uniref:Cupin domain-containing protein n=1 Tax=Pontibacter qinzhouensis TaxID=2603253 RepID=A0A5C8JH99_9BACT|nr:cupin domain-containing protein [Pontibacter qinzhouensis]TXK37875.1 cupin domain-containing protein [Pontibacter qinzhouensis]
MKTTNVKPILLAPNQGIPNNAGLPLLLYQQVLQQQEDLVSAFKKAFAQNHWVGTWVNGVFDYHHYHSVAHEVLGVAAGTATLIFGGPGGEEIEVKAGDMVVLPAGTGHCRKHASADFKVVGAYPPGQQDYDICTATDNMAEKQKNIANVKLPSTDPVSGKEGPLCQHWLQ